MSTFWNIPAIILTCGGIGYAAVCVAAFIGYRRRPAGHDSDSLPRVSIIVPARNEERNIALLLGDLLAQDYPAGLMEIVAVDDASTDGTGAVIERHAALDPRIIAADTRRSTSPYSHKKRAVHEGILRSGGEIICTIDADCRVGNGWLRGMIRRFTPGVDLVAGEIDVHSASFMGWLEELEFTGIQAMAAGLMNAGLPVTCNGGNLAYRRSAFERAGGFTGIGDLVSGDDDLLMQKIAAGRRGNVVFVTGAETSARVEAAETPGGFLEKRIRWVSKIRRYPSRPALALMVFFFAFFLLVPVWTAGALAGYLPWLPLFTGYGLKTAGDVLITAAGLARKHRSGLLFLVPLAELVHAPYILFVTIRGATGGFNWRGRYARAVTPEAGGSAYDR